MLSEYFIPEPWNVSWPNVSNTIYSLFDIHKTAT